MSRYKQPYSLHKRGKYWYYQTYINGLRTTARTTGQTNKTLAREFCEDLLKHNKLFTSHTTLAEYADGFYDRDNGKFFQTRIAPITDATLKPWASKLQARILPALGYLDLSEINFNVVSKFRADLIKSGLAYGTVRQTMQSLKNVLDHAARANLMQPIPWAMMEVYKDADKHNRDGFTFDEVISIFKLLPDDLRDFVIVLILTGTRISEAYGLRENDVQETNGKQYIHLNKQMKSHVYEPLKTKDARDLAITPRLTQYLHPLGYSPPYIYESANPIIRTCRDWEQRKLSIHSFRHFFISNTKASGINPQLVEKYAGHSLRGMQEVYTAFHVEDYLDIVQWQEKILDVLEKTRKENPTAEHRTMQGRKK